MEIKKVKNLKNQKRKVKAKEVNLLKKKVMKMNYNLIIKKISNIKKAENDIVDNLMGDVFEFIESSNINVGKCFSKGSNFLKDSYGAYIVIFLFK